MPLRRTPWLLLLLPLLGQQIAGSTEAALQTIRLSVTQLATGKITFAPVLAAAPDAAGSTTQSALRLTGQVIVPPDAADQMLAPVAGRVDALLVHPGETVRKDQPLLRLHSATLLTLQREWLATRAQAEVATIRAKRDETLHGEGIVALNRVQETRSQLAQVQAELRERRQLLRLAGMSEGDINTLLRAVDMSPLIIVRAVRAGTVLELMARPGVWLEAGDPLLRTGSVARLWVDLRANRRQLAQLALGDHVQIAGCEHTGRVIAVAPQLDSASQTAVIRAEMPADRQCLMPNQYVEASVLPAHATADLVSVHAAGIVQRDGKNYLFQQAGSLLKPVEITVLRRVGQQAWVRGAIHQGDSVVSGGAAAVKGAWLGLGVVGAAPAAP
jgi:membrane fusion protein, heavy metal efflux system